jgi:hypothetical protein
MPDFNIADMDLGGAADIDGFLEKGARQRVGIPILQGVDSGSEGFDLGAMESGSTLGIDAIFAQDPRLSSVKPVVGSARPTAPVGRTRVASIRQLAGFDRVSAETLVHRSQRDLWSLGKEADGTYYIERLFDDNGQPVRG